MFKLEDQIYIAKWVNKLSLGELSRGLHVNIRSVIKEIQRQKEEGTFEKYRNLTDEEYEKICVKENFKKKMRRMK